MFKNTHSMANKQLFWDQILPQEKKVSESMICKMYTLIAGHHWMDSYVLRNAL